MFLNQAIHNRRISWPTDNQSRKGKANVLARQGNRINLLTKNHVLEQNRKSKAHQPTTGTPFNHLKGRNYVDVLPIEVLDLFQVALEIYNRKGVRPMKKSCIETTLTTICSYFYECVGKVKVSMKSCTDCRDTEKQRHMYDYYYMNLVEISQERTVRCSNCMYRFLKEHIHGSESNLRQELKFLRLRQVDGVLVDPFSISCGQ